jgi:hypothetical protein
MQQTPLLLSFFYLFKKTNNIKVLIKHFAFGMVLALVKGKSPKCKLSKY